MRFRPDRPDTIHELRPEFIPVLVEAATDRGEVNVDRKSPDIDRAEVNVDLRKAGVNKKSLGDDFVEINVDLESVDVERKSFNVE